MKGKLVFLIISVTVVIALVSAVFLHALTLSPAPGDTSTRAFVINRGESASLVAARLQKSGFIKSSVAFKLIIKTRDLSRKIKAGEYQLSSGLNLYRLIEVLQKGAPDIWVTLPEGLRREEIAILLASQLSNFDPNQFVALASSPKNLEGYLFPDTYHLPKTASPGAVIKIFEVTFTKKANQTLISRANGLTEFQTVVLASLLEREARLPEDKKIIAGLLIKRYQSGWPLDIDATLQYATASTRCRKNTLLLSDCKWWLGVLPQDKKIASPYNTYAHPGFPPSPIANPGLSSIEAASNPIQSDYWFYLSSSDGQTHFSSTLEEHQRNIAKYL